MDPVNLCQVWEPVADELSEPTEPKTEEPWLEAIEDEREGGHEGQHFGPVKSEPLEVNSDSEDASNIAIPDPLSARNTVETYPQDMYTQPFYMDTSNSVSMDYITPDPSMCPIHVSHYTTSAGSRCHPGMPASSCVPVEQSGTPSAAVGECSGSGYFPEDPATAVAGNATLVGSKFFLGGLISVGVGQTENTSGECSKSVYFPQAANPLLQQRVCVRHLGNPPGECSRSVYLPGGAAEPWPRQRACPEAVRPFICDLCGFTFSRKQKLVHHLHGHLGKKPFTCDICKKNFSLKANLKTHLRIHTGERPYQCSDCDAMFSDMSALKTHTNKHTGAKRYMCKQCNRSFSQSSNLIRHTRTHSGEIAFACKLCGRQFSDQSNLSRHMRGHVGEMRFSCSICGRRFAQKTHLQTHLRTHDNTDG